MNDKDFRMFLVKNKQRFDQHMDEFDRLSIEFDKKIADILSKL